MTVYTVRSTSVRAGKKSLFLQNKSETTSSLSIHRFAMVGPGDNIRVTGSSNDFKIALLNTEKQPNIPILPRFECHHQIRFGDERLNIVISEIFSNEDYEGYKRLEQFHYKGINLEHSPEDAGDESKTKTPGGRRALLLASVQKNGLSRAIGYIEIQMPLMMCKPRHVLFSRPFCHSATGASWERWLGDGQKYVNLIARIARVVVDPEFRGIGISPLLVQTTKAFCRERWHIGGVRPLFLEISAEMLRYVDFVSQAGLHYVGTTEGNLQRISKDLESIEKGAAGKSGIMSLQKKYHTAFMTYCKKTGRSFQEARLVLSELLKSKDPRSEMASDEWLAFRPILRFPIPYFIAGLDTETDKYVLDGLIAATSDLQLEAEQASVATTSKKTIGSRSSHESIQDTVFEVNGLEVRLDYKIPLTPYVRLVMDSFGIESQRIQSRLLGPINIAANYGNVVLLTGASGAGKSVLLQALSNESMAQGLIKTIRGKKQAGDSRMLAPLPEGVPIFQFFAENYGPDRAFSALCQVGLSEAMIFIKPFEVLSMGQRYRAMFADLILSDAKIWLIDEFCSNLDPITSKIISVRLRKLAQRSNRCVIVAAANTEHFIRALAPDQIFVIRIGGEINEMRTTEYMNGFYNKGF